MLKLQKFEAKSILESSFRPCIFFTALDSHIISFSLHFDAFHDHFQVLLRSVICLI